jgi:hypothetical protein
MPQKHEEGPCTVNLTPTETPIWQSSAAHDSLKDQDTETSTTEQKKGNYEEKRHCTNSLKNNIWE